MNNIGVKLHGYCNGYFGRDDYEDKIIIAEGKNGFYVLTLTSTTTV